MITRGLFILKLPGGFYCEVGSIFSATRSTGPGKFWSGSWSRGKARVVLARVQMVGPVPVTGWAFERRRRGTKPPCRRRLF